MVDRRNHKYATTRNTTPAMVSSATSQTVPVRDGMWLWCHSSIAATNTVPNHDNSAARNNKAGTQPSVARQPRSSSKLNIPYPTTCPVLRR